MKIAIASVSKSDVLWKSEELRFLERHFELEGDEIVGVDDAELILTNIPGYQMIGIPVVKSGEVFKKYELREAGLDVSEWDHVDFFFTKWYDSKVGWAAQTFLGIPIYGLMNGGIGARVVVGCCGCWISRTAKAGELFTNETTTEIMKTTNHSGFVSVCMSVGDGKVIQIETGVPGFGMYNILEGVVGKVSTFLTDVDGNRCIESWTTSLLLSRYPFPSVEYNGSVQVTGLMSTVEKHFWMPKTKVEKFKTIIHTTRTAIGVATAWAKTMSESSSRAVMTCRNVGVKEAQYRTDANHEAGIVFGRVKELGLLKVEC